MKSFAVLIALTVIAIPAAVSADDEVTACSDGYVTVISAGGPLCVNPIYLDGTWEDDPATCQFGYYQGSCAPQPTTPEPLPVAAYTFQMTDPSPEYVAEIQAKRIVWLSDVELQQANQRATR